jgi:hypothetical protein
MPLRIATANLDFNLPGDADYIAHLCETSDVVLVQEAKNVRLAKVAPVGFTALQDTTDQAHMGTGILVRDAKVEVGRHGATLGVKPILRTGRRVKMLARHIYSAHLTDKTTHEGFLAVSAHFPPRRFLPLQRPFRNALAGVLHGHAHSVTGTDANQPIGNVAKALGLSAKGQGIVGLLGGKGVTVSKTHVAMWGVQHKVTDHPSVAAEVSSVVVKPPTPPAPHGFMPGAIIKNIPPGSSDPAIIPAGVLQHIAVSNSDSLFPLFSNDGGIESHFYIRKDGTIEQYRSIYFEADAQFAGNSFGSPRKGFISVEHQGGVGADLNVPMPKAQLDAFHRVIQFVHSEVPFPLRVCPAWNQDGVGYHALYVEWNTNHHSCPGAARIKQFHDVTVPWLKAGGR